MIDYILKRSGRRVSFDSNKISNAIRKAFESTDVIFETDNISNITNSVLNKLDEISVLNDINVIGIESIQDLVEESILESGYTDVAKNYIEYRRNRKIIREINSQKLEADLREVLSSDSIESDLKRDNANVDGNTAMGTMLQSGSAATKAYNEANLLTKEQAFAHRNGDIHIHDFDFYNFTTTCCQIDIAKLFKNGFSTGHGYLREPQSIKSAASLACIAIQANQNDQHGGQGIPNFDYGLAPYVKKTFIKEYIKALSTLILGAITMTENTIYNSESYDSIESKVKPIIKEQTKQINFSEKIDEIDNNIFSFIWKLYPDLDVNSSFICKAKAMAYENTDKETHQAMESVIHNLNTMHSRAGAQVPFSSLNYGTDTSPEGRMIIKNVLKATEEGLGNGETPIFPIQIFKLMKGINFDESDPNYDLFRYACEVSTKRLFPNFVNLDAPFNKQYYIPGRPETEVVTMGCRTRVMANYHDQNQQTAFGRGNLSFTSINLPRIGLEAKGDEKKFYKILNDKMKLVVRQLLDRFEIQGKKRVYNFPFLMEQGIWLDSDKLSITDDIREVLKHGSLSIGFIGLAETLVALYGHHHGESNKMQEKGLEIVQFMYDFCDKKAKETKLNFSLLATPAEGLSGRFIRIDKEKYGEIPGVTDKEYYTNSFHIPVYFPISIMEKIDKEAPYHSITPAGHITYVEVDGDISKNVDAFVSIIKYMHDKNIGYGSINHPVDRDPICGYVGIIDEVCPRCGRKEGESLTEEQLKKLKTQYANSPVFRGLE